MPDMRWLNLHALQIWAVECGGNAPHHSIYVGRGERSCSQRCFCIENRRSQQGEGGRWLRSVQWIQRCRLCRGVSGVLRPGLTEAVNPVVSRPLPKRKEEARGKGVHCRRGVPRCYAGCAIHAVIVLMWTRKPESVDKLSIPDGLLIF